MPLQAQPDIRVSSTDVKPSWSMRNTRTPSRLTKTSVCAPPLIHIADQFRLGTFLLNNYKQALEILDTRSAVDSALVKVGARDMVMVKEWLKEEEDYLRGLSKEPLEETLEMEYYKLLLNFNTSEYVQFFFLLMCIVTYDLQTDTCRSRLGLVQSYGGEHR